MTRNRPVVIALGSNQIGPWGTPRQTIARAILELGKTPLELVAASTPIETPPFGRLDQPNFINAVVITKTQLSDPGDLMRHLHDIEARASRIRFERWGPRTLDLDLIDFRGQLLEGKGQVQGHDRPLTLPHPGIAEREFVLRPLAEIAADWRHPITGLSARTMLAQLCDGS